MRELNQSDINMISAGHLAEKVADPLVEAGLITAVIVFSGGVMFAGILLAFLLEEA